MDMNTLVSDIFISIIPQLEGVVLDAKTLVIAMSGILLILIACDLLLSQLQDPMERKLKKLRHAESEQKKLEEYSRLNATYKHT